MDKFMVFWKKYGMFALLAALILLFTALAPTRFATTTVMFNILKQASVLGVLSCGVTMILITGQTDISIGSRVAFTSLICGQMLLSGSPVWLVVLVALFLGAATGAINAILTELLNTYLFVISMAMMYVWTGICYLMTGASSLYGFPNGFKAISQTLIFGQVPSIILVFAASALLSAFILGKTYFGRYTYAIGANREAAYLAGIPVKKYNIMVQAVAGCFIGAATIIHMSRTMTAIASTGGTFAFDCITACVLGGVLLGGGMGKILNAMLGVLVLNVLFNGLTIMGVNDFWQMVIKGGILLIAIWLEVLQRRANAKATKVEAVVAKQQAA